MASSLCTPPIRIASNAEEPTWDQMEAGIDYVSFNYHRQALKNLDTTGFSKEDHEALDDWKIVVEIIRHCRTAESTFRMKVQRPYMTPMLFKSIIDYYIHGYTPYGDYLLQLAKKGVCPISRVKFQEVCDEFDELVWERKEQGFDDSSS